MAEQAPQPLKPEQAPKRRKWGLVGGVVVAATAAAAMFIPHGAKDTVDARPAPSASAPSPETPVPGSIETATPAATDIPEQLVEGRRKLQAEATNTAVSLLQNMDRPNAGMTREGLDNFTIGNPSEGPNHAPEMLATFVPAENLIKIRSILGGQNDGDALNGASAQVDLEFQVTPDNAITTKTDQLTTGDFRDAVTDTAHTTLLRATAKADGKWLALSFDEHRVRATDIADDPNNIYIIDGPKQYDAFSQDLANTMRSAQEQLTAASHE